MRAPSRSLIAQRLADAHVSALPGIGQYNEGPSLDLERHHLREMDHRALL